MPRVLSFRWVMLLAFLGSALFAPAMSVVPTDFDRLIEQSELIVHGRVESVVPAWEGEGKQRHIVTYVTLRVEESFLGGAKGALRLRFFGGQLEGRRQRIAGMPEFQVGEAEFLFVRGNGTNLCPLVGIHHGRLRIAKSAGPEAAEQVLLHDGTPLSEVGQIGKSGERLRPAAGGAAALSVRAFGEKVRAALLARGRQPDPR